CRRRTGPAPDAADLQRTRSLSPSPPRPGVRRPEARSLRRLLIPVVLDALPPLSQRPRPHAARSGVNQDRAGENQETCGDQRLVADERERLGAQDRDGDEQSAEPGEGHVMQPVEHVAHHPHAQHRDHLQRHARDEEDGGDGVAYAAHGSRSIIRAKVSDPTIDTSAMTTARSMKGWRRNPSESTMSAVTVRTPATSTAASAAAALV